MPKLRVFDENGEAEPIDISDKEYEHIGQINMIDVRKGKLAGPLLKPISELYTPSQINAIQKILDEKGKKK